jgi:fluoroquinolone transport system ATP-binding protein
MINVQDLSYTYTGTTEPAIKEISFAIDKGEIFGFLGPSGAGKSTTQKVLIGLLRDYQGDVRVFDQPLNASNGDYYERIGVSFELPNHYLKLTALENLRYFGALYQARKVDSDELLEKVGLEADGDTLVSQYSKGMKNRLSVARSLLHNPELLFLDEPTAGLDPVNARRIRDLIRAQRDAGRTIFLTTHDMNVADQLCDRVAFIVDGKIALIDSPRALKLKHGRKVVQVEYNAGGKNKSEEFALDGLAENKAFLAALRNDVQTIHTGEATLEDIFIEVTGRSLV